MTDMTPAEQAAAAAYDTWIESEWCADNPAARYDGPPEGHDIAPLIIDAVRPGLAVQHAAELAAILDDYGHTAAADLLRRGVADEYPDQTHAAVTVRDLIRATRSAGAPLRRVQHPDRQYRLYECWSDSDQHRWATIRRWTAGGTIEWSAEINGRDVGDGSTTLVGLWQPTVQQLADAARLCGWEVAS